MTMFKKVFGSQMAASEENREDDVTQTEHVVPEQEVAPSSEEIGQRPPPSTPLFAPLSRVLTTKEEENAARRAEKEAEVQERMRREAKAAAMPSAPEPAPMPVMPPPPVPSPPPAPPQADPIEAAQPSARPGGRARTRLLGFGAPTDAALDPMAGPVSKPISQQFPTGWVVVVSGPGKGHFFPLFNGVSSVGRDEDQAISLAFGDMTISRENHAAIAYDAEENQFFVGHGGKSNIIRLNGRPVLSTETLGHGDSLRIGETVLRFAAFCGAGFDWTAAENG